QLHSSLLPTPATPVVVKVALVRTAVAVEVGETDTALERLGDLSLTLGHAVPDVGDKVSHLVHQAGRRVAGRAGQPRRRVRLGGLAALAPHAPADGDADPQPEQPLHAASPPRWVRSPRRVNSVTRTRGDAAYALPSTANVAGFPLPPPAGGPPRGAAR